MLLSEGELSQAGFSIDLFKKQTNHINIGMLMQRGANPHILKNKTSDKFSRRDVQFYDLYIKKDNGEELARLRDNQYPLDISAEAYYKDIEV